MSKRKPHNPAKRANALAATLIKPLAITWVGGDKTSDGVTLSEAWHIKQGRRVQVGINLYRALTETRTHWQICMVVFCRDQFGKQYAQTKWVETNQPYLQSELADLLNDEHTAMWAEANHNHRMNLGWVAYPSIKDRVDDEPIKLLEKRNCWEVLAPWEAVA